VRKGLHRREQTALRASRERRGSLNEPAHERPRIDISPASQEIASLSGPRWPPFQRITTSGSAARRTAVPKRRISYLSPIRAPSHRTRESAQPTGFQRIHSRNASPHHVAAWPATPQSSVRRPRLFSFCSRVPMRPPHLPHPLVRRGSGLDTEKTRRRQRSRLVRRSENEQGCSLVPQGIPVRRYLTHANLLFKLMLFRCKYYGRSGGGPVRKQIPIVRSARALSGRIGGCRSSYYK